MLHSQVMEIMGDLINIVKDNEPDTTAYEWYKSVDHTGAVRLTIIERYVDRAMPSNVLVLIYPLWC